MAVFSARFTVDQNCTQTPALGRRFQLGDLIDYRTDAVSSKYM